MVEEKPPSVASVALFEEISEFGRERSAEREEH